MLTELMILPKTPTAFLAVYQELKQYSVWWNDSFKFIYQYFKRES